MKRREFIAGLGGVMTWPTVLRAQQTSTPVIGLVHGGTLDSNTRNLAAFRTGLEQTGYVEGHNVAVEYHWLDGQFDGLPALMADLVRRRVAVIATPAGVAATLAAKAATSTIPIVFGVNDNPIRLGLVSSFPRPGGNLTGMNFLTQEVVSKRLELFHQLVPQESRVAVLINPNNLVASETARREVQDAARFVGLSIDILEASTIPEIEAVFPTLVRERIKALFISGDTYFNSRAVQFGTLATRYGIAVCCLAGGLMTYGADLAEMWHQVGVYAGQILKGTKPTDLPVVQSAKFEFMINLKIARTLGIEVPPTLLAIADEVIE
jgi:putative tryptophan/tyrosine transport system substrate-binding protein